MREIEFRGKSSHNGKWVFGSLLKIENNYHILSETDMCEDGHHILQESDVPTWVESKTIGQFTGIHDKNGKEIYEGDIVTIMREPEKRQRRELVRHVVTCHNVCDWVFESLAHEVCGLMMANLSDFDSYRFEVVGNIYDNPELAQPYSLNLPIRKPKKRKNGNFAIVIKFRN